VKCKVASVTCSEGLSIQHKGLEWWWLCTCSCCVCSRAKCRPSATEQQYHQPSEAAVDQHPAWPVDSWWLRGYSIIGSGSRFTINSNPKWIRLTLDMPKVFRSAKWIWTQIHSESWSASDNRIVPKWSTVCCLPHGHASVVARSHYLRQDERWPWLVWNQFISNQWRLMISDIRL